MENETKPLKKESAKERVKAIKEKLAKRREERKLLREQKKKEP